MPRAVIQKRIRRRVRQREKLHRRRNGTRRWPAAQGRETRTVLRIQVPTEVAIGRLTFRKPTLLVCRRLREAIANDGLDVVLDFSKTSKVEASGMLLITAELDRALRLATKQPLVRCKLPPRTSEAGKIVGQVLDQIGLLQRIGQAAPEEHGREEFHETVRHWRYATGTRIDEQPSDVLYQYEGRITSALLSDVNVGLSEAIINSLHHAYARPRDDGCKLFRERRWWMFTREIDGELQVLVCDLGIGIPRSLPLNWERKLLAKASRFFTGEGADVAAIKTALILGETSTDQENRGKGLPQVWNATLQSPNGAVGIFSGRAYVSQSADTGEKSGEYADQILGTLVSWRVPVEVTSELDG